MHKLGIIVPYRNRDTQLAKFKTKMQSYLIKKGINYKIIIVEQDDASAFNRGSLCNIGFEQAVKYRCDYVVFHDVDMLPIDVDYSYSNKPIHLATQDIPFKTYFGGMTLFPVEDFKKIDGFSNNYWGWGFEDDDLRHRCHRSGIDYGVEEDISYKFDGITSYFNGIDSYATVKNNLSFIRDFEINIGLRLGDFIFDLKKQYDEFPILTIPGFDFMLSYNSFNRFTLKCFDKKHKYYDITSDIILSRPNFIKIKYNTGTNTLALDVNEKLQSVQLDSNLFNYKRSKEILLGTDTTKLNFFKGSLDILTIKSRDKEIVNIVGGDNEKFETTHKVSSIVFNPKDLIGNKIPHRRESKYSVLKHKNQGYSNGVWQHSTTRFNQLRFNNDTVNRPKYLKRDGISTVKYSIHGKIREGDIITFKIGI